MSSVGLSTALSTALTGLNVNQQQLAVLSNNIANANTAGYSLQTANQHADFIDGNGVGVSVKDVTRQVDQNLINAVQEQNSIVGQTGVINDYNPQIQILIGQPGSNNSLDSSVNNFFNNLQALAQTPQNNALQQAAVNGGVALATQMQQTAVGLQDLQLQAEGDIEKAVTNINTDLTTLATLNHNISVALLQGQSVPNLEDQRDNTLNDLAQYLNISTFTNSDGSVNVSASNGVALIDGTTAYQLSYNATKSATTFANNGPLAPLLVYQLDPSGNRVGTPQTLATGGTVSQVTTSIASGKLAGLFAMRDQQIPDLLSQLDTLASSLRDQVNTIENSGSGYPGANSLTGERAVSGGDVSQWAGSVRIAVLNSGGQPIPSPYSDEPNGVPPLTLDLSSLNTGGGAGNPSVQGIIDAINRYFTPQNKVEVGNLNNVQLVSDSDSLPGSPPQLKFDLNLDNISADPASIYVTGVTVTPSTGVNTASVTSPVDLTIGSYTTTAGSKSVQVNTVSGTSGLSVGEKVYLSGPGTTVDGISASGLTGFFTITGISANGFTINAGGTAQNGATTLPVGTATVTPPYFTMPAGGYGRTAANGLFTASFGGNSSALDYTVTLNVAVDDGSGNPPATSAISYVVANNQPYTLNTFYQPQSATGAGTIIAPNSTQPLVKAMLVDADGNELPKDSNGNYVTFENGYLKIMATGSSNAIAIDSLNSAQQGQPNNVPPVAGSNLGFSQYFALNNFFVSNNLTSTGDTVAGSAANMAVAKSLQDDPGQISLGKLIQNTQPLNSASPPNYTYVRNPGDNSIIQQIASLSTVITNFPLSGGLSATSQTFSGYSAAIIGATASNASTATTNQTNAQTLLEGYQKQASTISGVNLDTELANTVIYQNAYAASARVITVTSTLFSTLLSAVPTS